MIESYISVNTLMSKIIRDIGRQSEFEYGDIKAWIAEVVLNIASMSTMIRDNSTLYVRNHRVKLPSCLVHVICVTHGGCKLRYGTDIRNYTSERTYGTNKDGDMVSQFSSSDFPSLYIQKYFIKSKEELDEFGNTIKTTSVADTWKNPEFDTVKLNSGTGFYMIDGDFIKTSFAEGYIEIDYLRIYTDKDGFPLIPDNHELKESIYYYVMSKMIGRGYDHPIVAGMNKLNAMMTLRNEYESHRLRALTQMQYPSIEELETVKAAYLRMMDSIYDRDYYENNYESIRNEGRSTRYYDSYKKY